MLASIALLAARPNGIPLLGTTAAGVTLYSRSFGDQ